MNLPCTAFDTYRKDHREFPNVNSRESRCIQIPASVIEGIKGLKGVILLQKPNYWKVSLTIGNYTLNYREYISEMLIEVRVSVGDSSSNNLCWSVGVCGCPQDSTHWTWFWWRPAIDSDHINIAPQYQQWTYFSPSLPAFRGGKRGLRG